jgi:hypothetical protein
MAEFVQPPRSTDPVYGITFRDCPEATATKDAIRIDCIVEIFIFLLSFE